MIEFVTVAQPRHADDAGRRSTDRRDVVPVGFSYDEATSECASSRDRPAKRPATRRVAASGSCARSTAARWLTLEGRCERAHRRGVAGGVRPPLRGSLRASAAPSGLGTRSRSSSPAASAGSEAVGASPERAAPGRAGRVASGADDPVRPHHPRRDRGRAHRHRPARRACVQPSSVDLHLDRYFRVFRNHTMPVIDVKQNLEELTRARRDRATRRRSSSTPASSCSARPASGSASPTTSSPASRARARSAASGC